MSTVLHKSVIQYNAEGFSKKELRALYTHLMKPRLIEEKMLSLLRQGKISKWFSGIGQEAIAVGVSSCLKRDELIFPMHRNLGVFTMREIPLDRLFSQWQGKSAGYTKGRDRSFHFGTLEHHIAGMISHLGPQLSLAAGAALGYKISGHNKVAVAFTGEGGTSEGEFHEAVNVAAVWQLPVLFIVENNGYGLSTPVAEQFRCASIADKGAGYGIESYQVDGNNVLDVIKLVRKLVRKARKKPRPFLIECLTFRMRGHEEASGTKYVPPDLMAAWGKKDPVVNFESFLLEEAVIDREFIGKTIAGIKTEISEAMKIANAGDEVQVSDEKELRDVYAPVAKIHKNNETTFTEMRFIDAISEGLDISMQQWPNLILMGQDIAEYGGVFKITEGFLEKYGRDRVRNTPLCESAIVGIGLGLSMTGYKSMVEMQFGDFVTCAFNQIVNNLAKIHYRWGQNADVVIRMPCGAGVGAGPFHSQTNEAWFTHTPGLKVVYPSNPSDAKGLLIAAFEDPNPVLYFEHKALYRTLTEAVPDGWHKVPLGKGCRVLEGDDLTIITYGMGVHWAKDFCTSEGIDCDLIDLRTLVPLDFEIIANSVKKTHKVVILHEDTLVGGFGGEIAAMIADQLFEYLDAPVIRLGSLDTPVPFAKPLEDNFLPKDKLRSAIERLMSY